MRGIKNTGPGKCPEFGPRGQTLKAVRESKAGTNRSNLSRKGSRSYNVRISRQKPDITISGKARQRPGEKGIGNKGLMMRN